LFLGWSWGLPKGCSGARVFQFLGPEGTITWPTGVVLPPAPGQAEAVQDLSVLCVDRGDSKRYETYASNALSRGYTTQIKRFLAAVRGEGRVEADLNDGYDAVKVALGLLDSARTGKLVTFG